MAGEAEKPPPKCPACGYDLSAHVRDEPDVICPECGGRASVRVLLEPKRVVGFFRSAPYASLPSIPLNLLVAGVFGFALNNGGVVALLCLAITFGLPLAVVILGWKHAPEGNRLMWALDVYIGATALNVLGLLMLVWGLNTVLP